MADDIKLSARLSAGRALIAPLTTAEKASQKVSEALKAQKIELKSLKAMQSDLGSFARMENRLNSTKELLSEVRLEEARLAEQMRQTEQPTKKLTRAFELAQVKANRLEGELSQQGVKLESYQTKLSAAGIDTKRLADEQTRLARVTKQTTASLQQQEVRLKALSASERRIQANRAARAELRGSLLETAAMGYVAAQPLQKAISFESAMADVKKVVNFDGGNKGAEAQKMTADILKLSTQLPMTAEEIAQIVAAAGQSSIAKKDLLSFATDASKMGVAFNMEAKESGVIMAKWRTSMGLSQVEAVKLANATNHLSNNLSAEAKDIAGVMKRVGALGQTAGLDVTQTASLAASILGAGATEEIASTALKNITNAFMKGDTATKQQKLAWSQLGFDPKQLTQDMLSDAPNTMMGVFDAFNQVPEAQQSAMASVLFGEEAKDEVIKLIKNMDNLRKSFKLTAKASAYSASMEDEFKTRSETTANQLKLLSNSFDRVQINLASAFLPTITAIAGPLADATDSIADFAQAHPEIAKGITGVTLGLIGLKAGVGIARLLGLSMGQGVNLLRSSRAKLNATTGDTTRQAIAATQALRGFNAALSRTGRGGIGLDDDSGPDKDGKKRKRRQRGGGKWGRVGGMLAGGSALGLATASASASEVALMASDMAQVGGTLSNAAPALQSAGKVIRPLNVALQGAALTSAVVDGDAQTIGATTGDIVGGLGGAAAGAAAGAAIGSVVPVVGTVVGGVVGSILGGLGGGALGEWGGREIGALFDDENTHQLPVSTSNATTTVNQEDKRQFVFQITVNPSGNPQTDQSLVDSMQTMLRDEVPTLFSNQLDVRLDASLSDRNDL